MKEIILLEKNLNEFQKQRRLNDEDKLLLAFVQHQFDEKEELFEGIEDVPKYLVEMCGDFDSFHNYLLAYDMFLTNKNLGEYSYEYDEGHFGNIEEFLKLYYLKKEKLRSVVELTETSNFHFFKKEVYKKQMVIVHRQKNEDYLDQYRFLDILKFELELSSLILYEREIVNENEKLTKEGFINLIEKSGKQITDYIVKHPSNEYKVSFLEEKENYLELIEQFVITEKTQL